MVDGFSDQRAQTAFTASRWREERVSLASSRPTQTDWCFPPNPVPSYERLNEPRKIAPTCEMHMSTVMSEKDIQTFEQDGVLCLRGVLDGEWVERMREALDHLLKTPTQWSSKPGDAGHVGVLDSYMYLYNEDFRDLALKSPLGRLAAECMRSQHAAVLWDFFLIKEPH